MNKKLEGIKRINNSESLKKIALEFRVGETTVGDLRHNKSQIEAFCSKMDLSKTLEEQLTLKKKAKTEKLDKAVYLWFKQQCMQGFLILRGHSKRESSSSQTKIKQKSVLLQIKLG